MVVWVPLPYSLSLLGHNSGVIMGPFDVIWYTSANKQLALSLLKRIPESLRLDLHMQGIWHIGKGEAVYMPYLNKTFSNVKCRVTLCYFPGIGSAPFQDVNLPELCDLTQIADGCIGGNFRLEIWKRPDIDKEVQRGMKEEEVLIKRLEELDEEDNKKRELQNAIQMRFDIEKLAKVYSCKLRNYRWQFWRPTCEDIINRLLKTETQISTLILKHWETMLAGHVNAHWKTQINDMEIMEQMNNRSLGAFCPGPNQDTIKAPE